LQQVLGGDGFKDVLFASLLDVAAQKKLVQHEIRLFEIENDVELADGAKVFVKQLDVSVDYFQRQKLIVRVLDGAAEVERGVPLVHDLQIFPFEKGAHFGFPCQYCGDEFPRNLLLHFVLMRHVPLLQPQFPLPAEQQHKLDHGGFESRKVVGEEKDGGWYGGR